MAWIQREISLPPYQKGCHPITHEVLSALPELEKFQIGLLNIFIRHTSASLTLNENADPDVPADLEKVMNCLAPEDFPYAHTIEGPDDMPAHLKTSLTDASLNNSHQLRPALPGYLAGHFSLGAPTTIVGTSDYANHKW